nr:MAG: hypothetical protein [Bacteriophage sp.]
MHDDYPFLLHFVVLIVCWAIGCLIGRAIGMALLALL